MTHYLRRTIQLLIYDVYRQIAYLRVIARMVRTPVTTSSNSISTSKCQPTSAESTAIGIPILSNFGHVRMPLGVSSKYGEPGIKSSRALNDNFDQSACRKGCCSKGGTRRFYFQSTYPRTIDFIHSRKVVDII